MTSRTRLPNVEGQTSPAADDPNNTDGEKDSLRLVEIYHRSFEIVLADTNELRREAYRLRYQVYCVENAFEDPAENPDGLETDEYDANAAHALLIHRPSGHVAGTVRLILPSSLAPERSFPLQNLCNDPILDNPDLLPIHQTAEVSRFCISKEMRRRQMDKFLPSDRPSVPPGERRRVIPNMMLGLIEALVLMSAQNGIRYWCAGMEPQLLRLLSRIGIYFEPIGPMIDHHGLRQPCYKKLDLLLTRVHTEKPDVWEVLTNDGAHLPTAPSADPIHGMAEAI